MTIFLPIFNNNFTSVWY